jgi:uncharacterized damage-inducible protein DinB
MSILAKQYDLIKSARTAVFKFLGDDLNEQLFVQLPTFNKKTIAYMLVHVANTYISWIENFTLDKNRSFYDDQNFSDLGQIRSIFEEVDSIMEAFLDQYENSPDQQFANYKSGNRYVTATILELFTHVTTHEFHHKGQVMTMCRLLGHVPPDADIIRF